MEIQDIRDQLAHNRRTSSEMGISVAQRLTEAAEMLLLQHPDSLTGEPDLMDTIHRSVDVVSLLIHDAGRRQRGYPPAALHEAVFALMEQIERMRPGLVRPETAH